MPFAIAFASTLLAQDPSAGPRAAAVGAVTARASVAWHDGQLVGVGRDYKVEFTADGVGFVPAFGANAPHDLPVRWHARGLHRGGAIVELPAVAPTLRAGGVDYERAGVREHFAVEAAAMEQTFTLTALPPGDGDLVVVGDVTTELAVAAAPDGALQFTAERLGSCRLSDVVGIDANGERCRGSMRCRDGVLEYVLPAAFVRRAALPLVVDPTWWGPILVENSAASDRYPDVAFAANPERFFVVWEHTFSATDHDVYGQLVDASTYALDGPRQLLAATGVDEAQPTVAAVGPATFVVAWQQGTGVAARTFAPATYTMGALFTVATTGARPDLGGHVASATPRCACVWQAGFSVAYSVLTVSGSTLSVFSGPSTLLTGTTTAPFTFPAISKSTGAPCDGTCTTAAQEQASRWAIVAQRDFSTDSDLHFRAIDFQGNVVGSLVLDSSLEDHDRADVDGNGRDWIVAWQRNANGERDVLARHVSLPLGSTTVVANGAAPVPIAAVANRIEILPSVTCIEYSCLIGYVSEVSAGLYQPHVQSRSLIGCEACAGDAALPGSLTTSNTSSGPVAASAGDLGPHGADEALVAFDFLDPANGGNGQILAWEAIYADGLAFRGVGGCGASGTVMPTCAINQNAGFRLTLRDSLPGANAWLVLSPTTIVLPCGNCMLRADPFAGVVLATVLDAQGGGSIAIPMPSFAPYQSVLLHAQWLIANPNAAGCAAYGLDLSNEKTTLPIW